MMKRLQFLYFSALILSLSAVLSAQMKYDLPQTNDGLNIELDQGIISGNIKITHFFTDKLVIGDQSYLEIKLRGAFSGGEPGRPDLPVFSKLFEIMPDALYELELLSLDSSVFDLNSELESSAILPVFPSVRKGSMHDDVFNSDASVHENAIQYKNTLITLEYQGKMRGVEIGRIQISPFVYDSIHKKLTIYHSIEFRLRPDKAPKEIPEAYVSAAFDRNMKMLIRNTSSAYKKRLISEEPLTMVILSDTLFRDALQPLIEWKTAKGFRIIEAYTSNPEVGSDNSDIQEYLSGLYHFPEEGFSPPSYLLIAGDVEHVPLSQSTGQITDLYYTTFDGDEDYLPEMFHGRLSVKNDTELVHIIDKILMYEKYEFPDPSFLNRSILIAGNDASYASLHGNGQIRYAATHYFNEENGIDAHIYLHPEASTIDGQILEDISEGSALVNYTGHGEYSGWLDPSFHLDDIDSMTNKFKYPLMIGNGCRTNQFKMSSRDCFAEAILKAEDKGAIGYIGCTDDSYWDEDFYWSVGVGPISPYPEYSESTAGYYDKLFHTGNESVEDWAPSMGEMIFAGNMTVQQSTSSKKKYYWEIYQLMGDPSLVPWFTIPNNITPEYPEYIPPEATMIGIKAQAYDYIALSSDGVLLTARHADKYGQAYIELPDTLGNRNLNMIITGDHRQVYMDSISRNVSRRGYLELTAYSLASESVREDGLISEGEKFSLNISLVNRGSKAIHISSLLLECSAPFITIEDSLVSEVAVNQGDTLHLNNVFMVSVADSLSDMLDFILKLSREPNVSDNIIYMKEVIHAPQMKSMGIWWDDRSKGNGNGIIEAGEEIQFHWKVSNAGSYATDSIRLMNYPGTDSLLYETNFRNEAGIASGHEFIYNFSSRIDSALLPGTEHFLIFGITDGKAYLTDTFFMVCKRHFEDFSSGDLSRFPWISANIPWKPDAENYSAGPYSFRSGNTPNGGLSSLSMEIDVSEMDSILFDYKVSSEQGYDFLKFFVDSVQIIRWSGYVGWERYSYQLEAGKHILEWRYQKDSNTIKGKDAAWIDNITFPRNSFDTLDFGVLKILSPQSAKDLGSDEKLRLLIANTGIDTIFNYRLAFTLDNDLPIEIDISDTLPAGERREFEFPVPLNLSELKSYRIVASSWVFGDSYSGNDLVEDNVNHYIYPDISIVEKGIDSISSEYTDLIIELRNEGNSFVSEWKYSYYIDQKLKGEGLWAIDLLPENSIERTLRLLSESDTSIAYGSHDYRVISDSDSLLSNNTIEGIVFWNLLSIESSSGLEFDIYPNPAHDVIIIRLPQEQELPVRASFLSSDGKIVHAEDILDREKRINVEDLSSQSGVYILLISNSKGELISSGKLSIIRL